MQNLHLKLTSKYPKYNNWHQTKHCNKIHWGVLVVFTLIVFSLIFNFTDQIYAQADTQAPTTPTNLTTTAVSSSQINLSWSASTDDVGVTGYKIYRCAGSGCMPTAQIATSTTNSYLNTGLAAGTVYTYAVSAYDAADNESVQSVNISATTSSQTSSTINIPWDMTFNCAEMSQLDDFYMHIWIKNCDGLTGGGGHTTLSGNVEAITTAANYPGGVGGRGQRHWIGPGKNNNSGSIAHEFTTRQTELWMRWYMRYEKGYQIDASFPFIQKQLYFDQDHYLAMFGDRWKVLIAGTDYIADAPGGFAAHFGGGTAISHGGWVCIEYHFKVDNPQGSNNGIVELWVNDAPIFSQKNVNLRLTNLSGYSFLGWPENATGSVGVPDGSGGFRDGYQDLDDKVVSNTGRIGCINSPTSDTTPPSTPANLTATAISSSQINLSWTASTDNVGVTGYKIYRCADLTCAPTVQIATSATNSFSDTGLAASTIYVYAVSAYDAAGNNSAQSTSASATTQAPSDATMPTISNISGAIAQGQTLTIVGSNMINDLKTKWDSIFTKRPNSYGFEGTNPALDGYNCATTVCSSQGVYDTSVKLMGNKSIKFHVQGESSTWQDALTSYNLLYADAPAHRDMWIRFYARWNLISGVWPRGWIKMIYDHTNYYFQPNNKEASDEPMPTNMYIKIGPVPYRVPIPSGALQNNRWYEFEVHWKTDISPFVFDVWMDGVQIWNSNPTYQDSFAIIPFGIINTGGTDSNFSLDHWWDGFAVSTSRIYPASTIEIGNSSNYATATKVYQEPIFLSDGSIQIKTNLTGLGSGPYYLWVTNNQQKQSATYNLSGSVIDTTPPSAPANLTATAISSSQINLSWTASTDDVGVTGYKIYRCAGSACTPTTQIATSATNSYSDTGLTASTAYTYAVSAYDAAGNESGKSGAVSATTLPQFKQADFNKDGVVNQLDFDILKQDWKRTDKPKSDLNQDGIVNSQDLGIMMSEWTR